jgi:hypothetical protein
VFGFVRDAVVGVFGAGLYTALFRGLPAAKPAAAGVRGGAFSGVRAILAEYKMRRGTAGHTGGGSRRGAAGAPRFPSAALGILAAPVIIYEPAPRFSAVPESSA